MICSGRTYQGLILLGNFMGVKKSPGGKHLSALSTDRRGFLRGGLAVSAGAAVAGFANPSQAEELSIPQWSQELGPGVADKAYGLPSRFEGGVGRKWLPWLQVARESSVSFAPVHHLTGTVTPNGLFFERHHGGIPDIDPGKHRFVLHGMVDRPLIFTLDEIRRFPSVSRFHFIECAANTTLEWRVAQMNSVQFSHGMVSESEWTGVALKTLLEEVGVKPGASWLLAEGADASAYARSIPLEKALDDAIIVYAQNGEALRPEQGYPLRLLLPGWEGSTNIKWLRRIKVGDKPWHTREETARYSDLMDDGTARQFTFVQEAKSVITDPCPEKPFKAKGFHSVSGLAWSGRGRITRVDVSFDGGQTWRESDLHGPVRSKSLTRFSIPWTWNGEQALLQSRAVDESGYVQPTIGQLRKARGDKSIYHNNMITTWHVKASGEVQNVQLD